MAGETPARRELGQIGEELARHHLEAKGLTVVDANYRCRWGEVDLIARDGPDWVFVEVRTRRTVSFGSPEESLTPEKARRLIATAHDFMERQALATDEMHWRIDLVAIHLGGGRRVLDIRHLENVVEA